MFQDQEIDTASVWWAATGAAVGLAAGWLLSARGRGRRSVREITAERELMQLEERIVDRLKQDPDLSGRDIEVAALTAGIIELSGTVRTDEEADRAIERAQDVEGVRTVLNRLDIEALEEHLEETRERYEQGAEELHETHRYGMRVGTGQRRQGAEPEPDRDSDKVDMITRELGVQRTGSATGEDLDKVGPAVQDHTTGPGGPTDRGTVDDSDPKRDLAGSPPESPQDVNTGARVHENVKPGTEATLEESGLEEELEERDREDGS